MGLRQLVQFLANKMRLLARAKVIRYLLPFVTIFAILVGGVVFVILWYYDVHVLVSVGVAVLVVVLTILGVIKLVIAPILNKLEALVTGQGRS